jgi:ankyrin repeat protein
MKKKCLLLRKTNHILDTFCFLLQVCRYLTDAVESGDVNTTKRWAHCNSDSCTVDGGWSDTPLIHAAANGHVAVVRVLLEGGADVERGDRDNDTALNRAAREGRLEVCRLLLDGGARVNTVGYENYTALHWAAWSGQLSVVKLLVERGGDVSLKNDNGRTAAEEAEWAGHIDVAFWLNSVSRV